MAIRVLDADTIQKIAAGEVVERPAAVAKELLENAIDAGSTQVLLALRGGGVSYLEVSDNGCGMSPEDALLAFERHATSKIREAADLEHVATLGFRGEALASIAAVSRVTLTTREPASLEGTRVRMAGGQLLGREITGCSPGTKVQVEDLFYNVPPRRRFLKSERAEGQAVMEIVIQQALAHPEVSFRAMPNGRLACQTPGRGDLREAVAGVLGVDVARQVLPLEAAGNGMEIQGYLGPPGMHRSTRRHQYIYINGRYIYHPRLAAVVEHGYATLIPSGRHPVFIIHLQLDPAAVDVNMHPNKLRVRLAEEEAVLATFRQTVARALAPRFPVPELRPPATRPAGQPQEEQSPEPRPAGGSRTSFPATWHETSPQQDLLDLLYAPPGPQNQAPAPGAAAGALPGLTPMGQLNALYILAAGLDGCLYIIDQHAAHERTRYEQLRAAAAPPWPAQELLVARPLTLPAGQAEALAGLQAELPRWGFQVEEVGPHTWWLRAIPTGMTVEEGAALLQDLVEVWTGEIAYDDRLEAGHKLVACRGAVKAGQKLELEEMAALLQQLASTPRPYTCPHGRPAVVRITPAWLERQFGR